MTELIVWKCTTGYMFIIFALQVWECIIYKRACRDYEGIMKRQRESIQSNHKVMKAMMKQIEIQPNAPLFIKIEDDKK